ncbi:hypothetical protein KSU19_03435 [Enterobacter quasiroggenkampii]|nr:hypothetical protein [Enterobacter quasiroggenkampii]
MPEFTLGLQDIIAEQEDLFLPARCPDDGAVIQALIELVERYPRYGFRSCFNCCAGEAIPKTINAFICFTLNINTAVWCGVNLEFARGIQKIKSDELKQDTNTGFWF